MTTHGKAEGGKRKAETSPAGAVESRLCADVASVRETDARRLAEHAPVCAADAHGRAGTLGQSGRMLGGEKWTLDRLRKIS